VNCSIPTVTFKQGAAPSRIIIPWSCPAPPFQQKYKGFCFEASWLLATDFKDVVKHSWYQPISVVNKAQALHIKLACLAKVLKRWNKEKAAESKKASEEAQLMVLQLDQVQDERQLTDEEFRRRTTTKNKILAIAAVKKLKLRQRSRLTSIRVGDANSKLFHLKANTRCHRNHIPSLQHEGVSYITHEAKYATLFDFYSNQFGNSAA
jgi:hypothetical protein